MCLVVFAYQSHPDYRLILAANRDEFYERPTQPMHWWQDPVVLAGLDEQGGGTWFGIDRAGRWAAVTNFRGQENPAADLRSRGELVTGFLRSEDTADSYVRRLQEELQQFGGFNLLVDDGTQLFWTSNRGDVNPDPQPLAPGIYGLSNALLNTSWPKVDSIKQDFSAIVEEQDSVENCEAAAFQSLRNRVRPSDESLPNTGVGIDAERKLSSIFIDEPDWKYGTRCSTFLTIDMRGNIHVSETTYPDEKLRRFKWKTSLPDIAVVEYDDDYASDTVAMWRASKKQALGVKDIHSFDNHVEFLRSNLVKHNSVYLAIDQSEDRVVAILAFAGTELNQLYVHVDYQRIGIGTQLLNLAKDLSPGKLQLYTFEVNVGAQAFYKQHGFEEIGRGSENEEGLPDIRYEWTRAAAKPE